MGKDHEGMLTSLDESLLENWVCTHAPHGLKTACYLQREKHPFAVEQSGNQLLNPVLIARKLPVPGQPDIMLPLMPWEMTNTPL